MIRPTKLLSMLLVCSLLPLGCGIQANKNAATNVAENLYSALAAKNWDTVLHCYADAFFQKTNKEEWRATLVQFQEKNGAYKSHTATGWNSQSKIGTGGTKNTVVLQFKVQYERASTDETLTIVAANGGDFRILGHRINWSKVTSPAKE